MKKVKKKLQICLTTYSLFYPAVFHAAEEGGFWVSFPDFPECFTEGDTIQQTYGMAVEAVNLALAARKEDGEMIPEPVLVDPHIAD